MLVSAPASAEPERATARVADSTETPPTAPESATRFRISTFNVLGAGHTDGTPPRRKNFAKSTVRTKKTVELLDAYGVSIVGFQEFQAPQFREFTRLTGNAYGVFPGAHFGPQSAPMHNSIAWRSADWTLIQADTLPIPYGFKKVGGKRVISYIRMPVILLQSTATGQQVWVSNFHNAADALFTANQRKQGHPQAHRNEARKLQIAMVNRLRAEHPGVPVFVLGDMNERKKYFCQVQRKAPLQAAGPGGITAANKCVTPRAMGVDWIFGSTDVTFANHQQLRTAKVKATSDHPLVLSDVYVAPPREQDSAVRRVVVISVDGLRAGYVRRKAGRLPTLARMMREGVSTMNARTVHESTKGLPNQLSMITGHTVRGAMGHGVTKEKVSKTVHRKAGRYVPSIFDVVHDAGRSTSAFTTDTRFQAALGSWSGSKGARDTQGLDNGTDKFSVNQRRTKTKKVITAARKRLKSSPDALTYVHLGSLDQAGHAKGFGSKRWRTELDHVDKQVGRLLKLVSNRSALRGSTMVVLTSAHGGTKKKHNAKSEPANYTVPFLIWGPDLGLPAGADLYALNPHLLRATGRVANSRPVVRNASVANVVLTALRLPSVSGSSFGWSQHVSWRATPAS